MSTSIEDGRRRAWLLGLVALLVASGTAVMAYLVVSSYQKELELARQPQGQQDVVVALKVLPIGLPIQAEDLQLTQVQGPLAPPDRVFSRLEDVVGKLPNELILPGEPVRLERLMEGDAILHIDAAIAPGTRAITVRVERAASVGGLLEPGFYVDVIVTIRPDNNSLSATWVTETILQGVRIVAINEQIAGGPASTPADEAEREERRRYVYVTLEVDPLEAEKVAMATARGDLVLSLRHAEDQVVMTDRGPLITNALVGLSPPGASSSGRRVRHARVERPAPEPSTRAEVLKGDTRTVEHFNADGEQVSPNGGRK